MNNSTQTPESARDPEQSLLTLTHVIYGLQAAGFVIGISWIVAVVINYVKLDEVRGTWLASHFRWQIRTFWFGLLWAVIGSITLFILIGWPILIANAVWLIYRIVKGWLDLNSRRPMYAARAAMT